MRPCRLARLVVMLALCLAPAGVGAGVNSWTTNGPASTFVRSLALDPTTPTTLYAGTDGGGVHRSLDGGASWAALGDPDLTGTKVFALAVDPSAPATVYAGTDASGIVRTLDGGATWDPINTGLTTLSVRGLAVDPQSSATVYAATNGGGIFKSTDGGASWAPANTGVTATVVHALAVDPTDSDVVYAGAADGVYKTTDGGAAWTNTGMATTVFSVAIDPAASQTLYAGTLLLGAFKSTDGGGTWTASNTGLTAPTVRTIVVEPAAPMAVYAGTSDGGLFISTDAGASWTPFNTGLTHGNVTGIAIDPVTTTEIHAATLGGGVFHYTLDRCDDGGQPRDCGACQTCDETYGCIGAPLASCRVAAVPGKARLTLKNDDVKTRDKIVWIWARGEETPLAAFGDPTTTTAYETCIFDEAGPVPQLVMYAAIPPAGICKKGRPCWKELRKPGFRYRNGEALPHGITKLVMRAGEAEKAKLVLKGKGLPLDVPALPMRLPFRLQLANDLGECWEASYVTEGAVKNTDQRFKGRSAP